MTHDSLTHLTHKTSVLLTLTLKMTTAQVVETSVTVNNNSPIQDYIPMDGRTQPTFDLKLSLKAGRNCLKSMRSG